MIQCVPHGMHEEDGLLVRRMSPVSELIRSRATTMCTPLLARTLKRPRPPAIRLDVVGPHAGAVDDDLGVTLDRSPVSTSSTVAPTMRSPARCALRHPPS
jgi:hypothetical protein